MGTKERQPQPQQVLKWPFIAVIHALELFVVALLLNEFVPGLLVHDWLPRSAGRPRPQFVSLHETVIILADMLLPSWLARVFEWNALRYLGKISFSVYLLHSFVIYAEPIRSQEDSTSKLAVQIVLIAALASASYYVIEVPCQRLSAKVSKALVRWGG